MGTGNGEVCHEPLSVETRHPVVVVLFRLELIEIIRVVGFFYIFLTEPVPFFKQKWIIFDPSLLERYAAVESLCTDGGVA